MKRLSLGRDRRGGTLALVAIAMIMLLGMAALAVDLSMAFAARTEAQRIADSAALAGGSAYLDMPLAQAEAEARDRAYEYALMHHLRGVAIDSSEVTVQIQDADRLVRVGINRSDLPTWFARILGIDAVDIGAVAAARVTPAGAARCLKPFAVPDLWDDADDDTSDPNPGDNVWQEGEEWDFNTADGDRYQRFDPENINNDQATGYGSTLRQDGITQDYGRQITIKVSNPQNEYILNPGLFYPWRLPPDPNMPECDKGGGGKNDAGAATYRRNICECNQSSIDLFTPYDLEPGNMIGPTDQGVGELMSEDPGAFWDHSMNNGLGGIRNSAFGEGLGSPRVIKVALFDISQITQPGMQSIEFNNFALLFLEGQGTGQDPVLARFLYFAGGEGAGTGGGLGSLVMTLRLVE